MSIWIEETEDQLITMVEERPALYNIREKLYANKVVKTQLWHEIENKLVIPEKALKKRWESLRTQYSRYKRLAPSGSSGAPKTGRQQWILTRLQFLEPHSKRKEATSNFTPREPLAAAAESDSPSDGTGYFNDEVLPSSHCSETRSSTPIEEFCIPLEESSICGAESRTPRPRAKRCRKMLDKSASEESTNLMRIIGKTLESLASREHHNDDISAYCKNFEHRMRKLPRHVLPHFLHEVDNCLFRYSVGLSPGSQPSADGQFTLP